MRKLFVGMCLLALPLTAHAQPVEDLFRSIQVFSGEAVASTGSATSSQISLDDCLRVESMILKATSSSGTADVKVEILQCWKGDCEVTGDNTAIVSSTVTSYNTPEGINVVAFPAFLSKDIKLLVTGVASNPADSLENLDLLCRIDQQ